MRSNDTGLVKYPWGHGRRYHAYPEYFRAQFGERLQKVAVDAGFTCPNRDGKVGRGGCTYCNNDAFNPSYCSSDKTISRQVEEGIAFHHKRYRRAKKFLVYFQAFTNTYAPLERLKKLYEEALSNSGVAGLVIGTRPDCVEDEKLAYLASLQKDYYIKLEFGIESLRDETLARINRGHTFTQSLDALDRTRRFNIPAGAHFILGLPGENGHTLMEDIQVISGLPLESIKFHQLQVVRGTAMASEYRNHPEHFAIYGLEAYLDLAVRLIEQLNPAISIERIAAEVPPHFLESPAWGLIRYDEVLRKFEEELEKRDSWQGKFFQPNLKTI